MPAPRQTVLVQVDHRSPFRLDPPVLAVTAVLPPPALDPPPPDHVADLIAPSPPQERRGHPGIALHRHRLVVPLGHGRMSWLAPLLLLVPSTRTYVRSGTQTLLPLRTGCQGECGRRGPCSNRTDQRPKTRMRRMIQSASIPSVHRSFFPS